MTPNAIIRDYPLAKEIHGNYGVIMHEAQMIDSRMGMNTLLTSSIDDFIPGMKGSILANYTEFVDFIKKDDKIVGAKVRDGITGDEYDVHAKVVVNCCGIFSDELRIKDNEKVEPRI
jgi:glycerol-3-phosphate dehydrogenase